MVTTQTLERAEGLVALNAALAAIKASIEESGGMFNIKLQVSVYMFSNKLILPGTDDS